MWLKTTSNCHQFHTKDKSENIKTRETFGDIITDICITKLDSSQEKNLLKRNFK